MKITFVLGIHGSISKFDMEAHPNGSPLVKIVFDPKSRILGIFNFKESTVGIFDGISGIYSISNSETGGISTIDYRTKIAKYIHNDADILKLFSNGVDKINYSCVFSTYRKLMTKSLTFLKKNSLPLQEHVYPFDKLTSDFYENPALNMNKHFSGKEPLLNELRQSFKTYVNHFRNLIANGDITPDMGTLGFSSALFNKQTPLSKAIMKFLINIYTKRDGKFDTTLLQRLSDAVTQNSTKKEMLVEDIIRDM